MLHIFSLRNLALCLRTRAEDSENTDHEHERGSAIVEFLGLGVTLLLPPVALELQLEDTMPEVCLNLA